MKSIAPFAIRAVLFVVGTIVCFTPRSLAQQTLLPPQPAPFLFFGGAISADSDIAIIGAMGSEQVGPLTGMAFIARRGPSGTWAIEADLHPHPAVQLGQFGHAVAIDGRTAAVGAPFAGAIEGFVYIYRRGADGAWSQEAAFTGPDMGHPVIRFGATLALQDDELFVSSSVDEIEHMWVFVYRRAADGTWNLHQALQPTGDLSLGMGSSLAVRGNRLIVGNVFSAAATFDPELTNAGAAYIFEKNAAGQWQQVALLTAGDPVQLNFFGSAVAIDGDTALVGALGRSLGSLGMAGAIYTFERNAAGQWIETGILTDPQPAHLGQLGHYIEMNAGRLVTQTWVDVNGLNTGRVRVFRRAGRGWQLEQTFVADAPAQNDYFGSSPALADGQLLFQINTAGDIGSVRITTLPPATPGDLNCDGAVNAADISSFVATLFDPNGPSSACNPAATDVNADGAFDGRDILAFVDLF